MLSEACSAWQELIADDMEVHHPAPSYTVDTLNRVRRQNPDAPVFWIVGVDAFREIGTWHQWRRVFELANLLLLNRPGAMLDKSSQALYENHKLGAMPSVPFGGILKLEAAMRNVSATAVRMAIKARRPIANLLPEGVEAYIGKHQLYATGQ